MNNNEIKLEKGDVIERGDCQWVYDGSPHWIPTPGISSHRSRRTASYAGHTVDLNKFDVWRDEKKLSEVPVETESEWVESEATMVRIGGMELVGKSVDGCWIHYGGDFEDGYINLSFQDWKGLGATFHKPKPKEPVVIEKSYQEVTGAKNWIPIQIDPTRPFKVTFEQEAQ
jgi:hypothetical protein